MLPKGYDSEQEDGRRERKMSEFEMTVSYRFAAFCVKVLKLSACKCYEEIGRVMKRKFLFLCCMKMY